jgi:AraC-like DNA-binding protein
MVSRARRYIASMMDAPLRVSEICRNIGASPRTLQYSFIEVLGITPLAYIKAVRLNAARRAIKGARQGRQDIGDIAFQYGFTHLSRFARDYKQAFGELPSQTRDRINPATRLDTRHSHSIVNEPSSGLIYLVFILTVFGNTMKSTMLRDLLVAACHCL